MGESRSEKEKRNYKRKIDNQEKRSKAIERKFRQEGCFGTIYRYITIRGKGSFSEREGSTVK
jgi:hypothetical protein